ncbi:hypothetical protein D621_05635 [beta proteobacterium AAP51]|nr:hypothetical protein D621_05635 [beta proteobacterium AAP51]
MGAAMNIDKKQMVLDVKRLLGDLAHGVQDPVVVQAIKEPTPTAEPTASVPAEVAITEMPKQVPWRLTVERDPVTGLMTGATLVPQTGGPAT